MSEPTTQRCKRCGKNRPTFLTPVCSRCIYRQGLATAKARQEAEIARERSQDRSGTVGFEGDTDRHLKAFDAFSRNLRDSIANHVERPAGGSR
jgi:ribosomal protein L37E